MDFEQSKELCFLKLKRGIISYNIELILVIHRFRVCKFTYSLKCICNPKSKLVALSQSFSNIHRAEKSLSFPTCPIPVETE